VPRTLVLVRHAESSKNTTPSFSAISGNEKLTDAGRAQVARLTSYLSNLAAQRRAISTEVFCSLTDRSTMTAGILVPGARVIPLRDLAPIRSPYPGMSEEQVAHADPEFIRLLSQYRLGLRSAYDIPRGQGEQVIDFERRIESCLEVICNSVADLRIVVGHRSTLTAILLSAARQVNNYPNSWYGHVVIPLASISLLEHEGKRFTAITDACRVAHEWESTT
jgi:broad specificity phosphatase PhoE